MEYYSHVMEKQICAVRVNQLQALVQKALDFVSRVGIFGFKHSGHVQALHGAPSVGTGGGQPS
jgi:bifunctional ADP-heptose synthase (sugar kinase/adenylyltransferase)